MLKKVTQIFGKLVMELQLDMEWVLGQMSTQYFLL
jgi:hypothetical protein